MTLTRFTPYPPRSMGRARLGFNIQQSLGVATARTRFLAAGAKLARWHPGWEGVENYATGDLALSAIHTSELAWCASNGVTPVLVAAYGPPYTLLTTVTVRTATAAGSYDIPVNESVSTIDPPYCYVRLSTGDMIVANGKWSYPGAFIHAVNAGTKTLTLSAATSVALTAGTSLQVQRVRYASLPDQDKTNPGVVAYLRYAQFLAAQIGAAGCPEGWVCLWNEAPWPDDQWPSRYTMYDTPPVGLVANAELQSILRAAVDVTGLPRGVRFINGVSDNTGFNSIVSPDVGAPLGAPVAETHARDAIAAEGQHPYGNNPESSAWDPASTDQATGYGLEWYQIVNPVTDQGSSFRWQARQLAEYAAGHGGWKPELIATECGADLADDTRHALKLLRRVISLWGMDVTPVIYTLADNSLSFPVIDPVTYAARPAHAALARLMSKVAAIGPMGGTSRALPTPISVPDSRYPAMLVGLYGQGGALLFAWQRTWATGSGWASITRPVPTLPVRFHIASGVTVVDSVDLLTGSTVTVTPSAGTFTLNLTDAPIAVRTTG